MDTQTQLSIFNGGSWTVQNSTITNRTLTNSSLRHSTLSSSVPTNCDIQGCTITSSTLINCRLYGISKVNKCLISALALLPSSSTLNKLPVEIRDMIFEVCLEGEWNGKLPALLAALKGSEDLYLQALKAFRKLNAGVLYDDHRGELQNIAENPLSGIKTLVVDRDNFENLQDMQATFGEYASFPNVHLKYLQKRVQSPEDGHCLGEWIEGTLKQCKDVTSMIVTVTFPPEIIPRSWRSQEPAVIPITEDYLVIVLRSLRWYFLSRLMWVTPVKLSVDDSTRTVTAICNARDGQVIEWRERFGER